MERGEVLDCIVIRHDGDDLWVEHGNLTGLVARSDASWGPGDTPGPGSRVKVKVRFTTPEADVPFDFVGSIKDAYPEKHPILFVDDSIIGTRFSSRTIPIGRWIHFKHPTGLPALLPREELGSNEVGYDDEMEAEVIGINRERGWLLVRLPRAEGPSAGRDT